MLVKTLQVRFTIKERKVCTAREKYAGWKRAWQVKSITLKVSKRENVLKCCRRQAKVKSTLFSELD